MFGKGELRPKTNFELESMLQGNVLYNYQQIFLSRKWEVKGITVKNSQIQFPENPFFLLSLSNMAHTFFETFFFQFSPKFLRKFKKVRKSETESLGYFQTILMCFSSLHYVNLQYTR